MTCKFLEPSPEAYAVAADGEATPVRVSLCAWPDMHPERFESAPNWLLRLIGPGLSVTEHECAGCPARIEAEVVPQQRPPK